MAMALSDLGLDRVILGCLAPPFQPVSPRVGLPTHPTTSSREDSLLRRLWEKFLRKFHPGNLLVPEKIVSDTLRAIGVPDLGPAAAGLRPDRGQGLVGVLDLLVHQETGPGAITVQVIGGPAAAVARAEGVLALTLPSIVDGVTARHLTRPAPPRLDVRRDATGAVGRGDAVPCPFLENHGTLRLIPRVTRFLGPGVTILTNGPIGRPWIMWNPGSTWTRGPGTTLLVPPSEVGLVWTTGPPLLQG